MHLLRLSSDFSFAKQAGCTNGRDLDNHNLPLSPQAQEPSGAEADAFQVLKVQGFVRLLQRSEDRQSPSRGEPIFVLLPARGPDVLAHRLRPQPIFAYS